jgi:hypothetical protein
MIRRKNSKNKIKKMKLSSTKFKIPFKLQSHGGQSKATKVTEPHHQKMKKNKKNLQIPKSQTTIIQVSNNARKRKELL